MKRSKARAGDRDVQVTAAVDPTVSPPAPVLLQAHLWTGYGEAGASSEGAGPVPPPARAMMADLLQIRGGELRDTGGGSIVASFSDAAVAVDAARNLQRLMQGFSRAWPGGVLGGCTTLVQGDEAGDEIDLGALRESQTLKEANPGQVLLLGSLCAAARAIPGLELRAVAGAPRNGSGREVAQVLPPSYMEGYVEEPFEAPTPAQIEAARPVAPPPMEPLPTPQPPAYVVPSTSATATFGAAGSDPVPEPWPEPIPTASEIVSAVSPEETTVDEVGAPSRHSEAEWAVSSTTDAVVAQEPPAHEPPPTSFTAIFGAVGSDPVPEPWPDPMPAASSTTDAEVAQSPSAHEPPSASFTAIFGALGADREETAVDKLGAYPRHGEAERAASSTADTDVTQKPPAYVPPPISLTAIFGAMDSHPASEPWPDSMPTASGTVGAVLPEKTAVDEVGAYSRHREAEWSASSTTDTVVTQEPSAYEPLSDSATAIFGALGSDPMPQPWPDSIRTASGTVGAVPPEQTAVDEVGAYSRHSDAQQGKLSPWKIAAGTGVAILAGILLFFFTPIFRRMPPQPPAPSPSGPVTTPVAPTEPTDHPVVTPPPVVVQKHTGETAHDKPPTGPVKQSVPAQAADAPPAENPDCNLAVTFTPAELSQLLVHAERDSGNGDFEAAIKKYQTVLCRQPNNEAAKQGLKKAIYNRDHP